MTPHPIDDWTGIYEAAVRGLLPTEPAPKPKWRGVDTFSREWPDAAFDVLVGGTPCQSFSVAGTSHKHWSVK